MNALVQSLSYLLSLQYAVIYFNVYKKHGLPNPQRFVIIRYFAAFKTAPLKCFTLPFKLTWGYPCFTGELPAASLFFVHGRQQKALSPYLPSTPFPFPIHPTADVKRSAIWAIYTMMRCFLHNLWCDRCSVSRSVYHKWPIPA